MFVTIATSLFETSFITLLSFSLCHVKAAVLLKRAAKNPYWDRTNVGVWEQSLSAGQFLRFFNKNDVILGIFELKFLLQKHILTVAEL